MKTSKLIGFLGAAFIGIYTSLSPAMVTSDFIEKTNETIPDSYIVTLTNGANTTSAQAAVQALQSEYTFQVRFIYEHCLKGFSAKMNGATAEALAADPRIKFVEKNRVARAFAQRTPQGIQRIQADKSSAKSGDGKGRVKGVDIYIIDTGIQSNHPDLNVVGGANFNDGTSYEDHNGHGTHVAGIAAAKDNSEFVVGVAPGADLYAVRVLGADATGEFAQVLAGIDWVTKRKKENPTRPMVANLSLGGYEGSAQYNSLDKGVYNSIQAGVVYVIAAGNTADDTVNYTPAHVKEAITVGAYDGTTNTWAGFSNYGPLIDILAPGVDVLSTYPKNSTYHMDGTSMASPHVAGTVALYLAQHPKPSAANGVQSALLYASLHPSKGINPRIRDVPAKTANKSVYSGNF